MATEPKKLEPFEKGKKTAWIGAIVFTLLLVILFVLWKVPKSTFAGSRSTGITTGQPRFGDFTVDINTNWYTVKNEDDSTLPYFHPLTKGVCWDLRIDMDDSKVFPYPPIDAPGINRFVYTNMCTWIEWRITPGQRVTRSKFTYTRVPRT